MGGSEAAERWKERKAPRCHGRPLLCGPILVKTKTGQNTWPSYVFRLDLKKARAELERNILKLISM